MNKWPYVHKNTLYRRRYSSSTEGAILLLHRAYHFYEGATLLQRASHFYTERHNSYAEGVTLILQKTLQFFIEGATQDCCYQRLISLIVSVVDNEWQSYKKKDSDSLSLSLSVSLLCFLLYLLLGERIGHYCLLKIR